MVCVSDIFFFLLKYNKTTLKCTNFKRRENVEFTKFNPRKIFENPCILKVLNSPTNSANLKMICIVCKHYSNCSYKNDQQIFRKENIIF